MAADRTLTGGVPKARKSRFNYPLASWSNALFVAPFVIVYALLLVVPLTGWALISVSDDPLTLWCIPWPRLPGRGAR